MRARLDDLAAQAVERGAAVAALTCYDLGTAASVIAAAEESGAPVVLLVPPSVIARPGGPRDVTTMRAMADASSTAVCIQFDHAVDAESIATAVAAGADAVLADASRRPFAENVAFVRAMRDALPDGVVVEAELGALAGDEDRAERHRADASAYTDPEEAARFVAASGAQLLAVAVGNVHGHYRGTPQIAHDRLARIRDAVPVPLVLHGASGLPDSDLMTAGARGIGKVNINTELRAAVLTAMVEALPEVRRNGDDVASLVRVVGDATRDFVSRAIRTLSGPSAGGTDSFRNTEELSR